MDRLLFASVDAARAVPPTTGAVSPAQNINSHLDLAALLRSQRTAGPPLPREPANTAVAGHYTVARNPRRKGVAAQRRPHAPGAARPNHLGKAAVRRYPPRRHRCTGGIHLALKARGRPGLGRPPGLGRGGVWPVACLAFCLVRRTGTAVLPRRPLCRPLHHLSRAASATLSVSCRHSDSNMKRSGRGQPMFQCWCVTVVGVGRGSQCVVYVQ